MTNDDRMFFLSSNPVNSRWDLRDGGQLWTVTVFFATGHGWSFQEALDDCIVVCQRRDAEAESLRAGAEALEREREEREAGLGYFDHRRDWFARRKGVAR